MPRPRPAGLHQARRGLGGADGANRKQPALATTGVRTGAAAVWAATSAFPTGRVRCHLDTRQSGQGRSRGGSRSAPPGQRRWIQQGIRTGRTPCRQCHPRCHPHCLRRRNVCPNMLFPRSGFKQAFLCKNTFSRTWTGQVLCSAPAITAGLRGSSSGMSFSILPTRSAPTSAACTSTNASRY